MQRKEAGQKLRNPDPQDDGFSTHGIISYGISQDLWNGESTFWWQNTADRLFPQNSLS